MCEAELSKGPILVTLKPKGFTEQKKRLAPFFCFNDIYSLCVFITKEKKIHWARVSSPVELIPIFNTSTIERFLVLVKCSLTHPTQKHKFFRQYFIDTPF